MADIFLLQARLRSDRKSDQLPEGGAKILFFTGVRCERIDMKSDLPTNPAGGGKSSGSGRNRRRRA